MSNSCLLQEVTLNQDPVRQYMTRAQTLEQQWNANKNNSTSTTAPATTNTTTTTTNTTTIDTTVGEPESINGGTFQGTSRQTFIPNGCCFLSKNTLELHFNLQNGTVTGTKKQNDNATTAADTTATTTTTTTSTATATTTTITGRWFNDKIVWLEETNPSSTYISSSSSNTKQKTVVSGFIMSPAGSSSCGGGGGGGKHVLSIKGDYYSSKTEFGKCRYNGTTNDPMPPSTATSGGTKRSFGNKSNIDGKEKGGLDMLTFLG